MNDKQTNLALSADVTTSEKLLQLADQLGPEICVLKTHIDIIDDFTPSLTRKLNQLALEHQFLIFEDRKFADIGNTVHLQYTGGMYRIADWADLINAHSLPGPGMIEGLEKVNATKERGLLLVAEMSSENNLLDAIYVQETIELAEQFPQFVIGFIAQNQLRDDPHWIYMTPGIKLSPGKGSLGQKYITPEKAIIENLSDIIIVGRAIIHANDPLSEAKKYRAAGWDAYIKSRN